MFCEVFVRKWVHTRDVWRVVVRSAVVGTQHIKIASNAIQYVEGCPSDGSAPTIDNPTTK